MGPASVADTDIEQTAPCGFRQTALAAFVFRRKDGGGAFLTRAHRAPISHRRVRQGVGLRQVPLPALTGFSLK